MDDKIEITLSERNKVQALQIAARDTSKSATEIVQAAEKFLAFLSK